jgi:hypothetical protein
MPDRDRAEAYLRSELREGDLVLTLGAGDIDALGRRLVAGGGPPESKADPMHAAPVDPVAGKGFALPCEIGCADLGNG